MPGILGVVRTTTNGEAAETCLQGMINPMWRHAWFKVEKSTLPGAGLASVSLIDEKTIAERGSVLLTYEGEIVDQEKLRARLLASGERGAHHYRLSEMLLALYLKFGAQALCGLNGIYVIAVWDAEQRKLTLINDRYGVGKLFYWVSHDQLMFASEMKAITWHPRFNHKISELAFSHYLSWAGMVDDITLFEDIKVLPQACQATYQDGRLSIQEYWDYTFYEPGSNDCNEKEYIAELYYQTREAVCKRIEKGACLFLTGGLDSRTIAGMFEQCEGGANLLACTIGLEQCKDVQFAREISNHLGIEHHFIPISPQYLADYAKELVWVTDGLANALGCWISAAWKFLLDQQVCFSMTGLNGELISGKHWEKYMLEDMEEDQFIRLFLEKEVSTLPEKILKPSIYKNVAGGTIKSIVGSFKNTASSNNLNKYEKLWMHQSMRRTAIGPYVLGDYSRVLEPFFDNDLVDFVLQIPTGLRTREYIARKMLLKHVPKVARGSYRHARQSLRSLTYKENINLLRVYDGARRRIRRKFFSFYKITTENYLLAHFPFNEWLRKEAKEYVIRVLNQKEYLEDLLDMQAVERLITEHMDGKRDDFLSISLLVTFSLWRQQFCGR